MADPSPGHPVDVLAVCLEEEGPTYIGSIFSLELANVSYMNVVTACVLVSRSGAASSVWSAHLTVLRAWRRLACMGTMRIGRSSGTIYIPNGRMVGSMGVELCPDEVGVLDRLAAGAGGGGAVVAGAGEVDGVGDAFVGADFTGSVAAAGCRLPGSLSSGDRLGVVLAMRAAVVFVLRDSSLAAIISRDTPAVVLT